MSNDGGPLLTIGQLSRKTGLAVRTIRFWSDSGAVPPAGRTAGGHRLYDAGSLARLELVRTLRELGLGLGEVRSVLQREASVADVAAAHVAALDAQIRSLRLTRAVLSSVARRHPSAGEVTSLNRLARLSARERGQIIEDFIAGVFRGLDAAPALDKLRLTPELPDDPSPEQVEAWAELAELASDPAFRQRMRTMAEYHAQGAPATAPGTSPGFSEKVSRLVGQARERGIAPDSPEAARIVDRLLEGRDAARRAYVRQRLADGLEARSDRYHQLLAVINGQQPRPSRAPDLEWLIAAIDSQPS